jgi:thioredoxin-related protein
MKKNRFPFLFFFVLVVFNSFGQGVNFQAISLKDAFEQARQEQKHVMVMFGSTHCGYSIIANYLLAKDKEVGRYMNENFINVAYMHPDGLDTETVPELMRLGMQPENERLENNEETVFTNYFVFPNFFFFKPSGEISYIFNGSNKIEKRILKASKKGLNTKTQTPFLFSTYFNNKMYPKSKASLAMLSETMLAYHQLEFPEHLDFSNKSSINWDDIKLPEANEPIALRHIEKSLSFGDYYFNQFLASIIYSKSGNQEQAIRYANNALENYPKHWNEKKRALSDELLKNFLQEIKKLSLHGE